MPQLDLSHMKSKKAICCLCIAEIVLCTFAFVVIFSLSLCVCMCVRCALWHFFIQLKSIFFSSLCLYTLSLWIGLFELMSHSHTPTYIAGYTHTTKVSLHFVPNARLRDYSMDCKKKKERKLCVHVFIIQSADKAAAAAAAATSDQHSASIQRLKHVNQSIDTKAKNR